jgi:DNA-binding NarL/FixJ family response regulator
VALVDDHHMVREGIAATINAMDDYEVVVQASHGEELIAQLHGVDDPAIAVVDLHMPVMDGFATIAWLRKHRPNVMALALTFDPEEDAMVRALRAGARGFLRKNARSAVLKLALDSLVLTGYFQPIEAQGRVLEDDMELARPERVRQRVLERMTSRELEFLRLVCDEDELTYVQISDRMGVKRNTVENYRTSLFDKFGIKSKTGLVLFAMRFDLLDTGER